MAISEETQAIINRLKQEGDLLRNSGTNSVKSVKIELSKFNDAFGAIRDSMGLLSQDASNQAEIAKRNADLAALSEDERNAVLRQVAENSAAEARLNAEDLARREKESKERDRKDRSIFGKGGIIMSTLGTVGTLLGKGLLYGGGTILAYEFLGGFLESQFGIDIPTTSSIFKGMQQSLSAIDWEQFKKNMEFLASPTFLAIAGGTYAGGKILENAAELVQTGMLAKILQNQLTPDQADVGKASKTAKFSKIRLGIVGIVAGSIATLLPTFAEYLQKNVGGLTDGEIAAVTLTDVGVGVGQGILAGAAIGSFGGVPGIIIGAIAGGVAGLALNLGDFIKQRVTDTAEVPKAAQDLIGALDDIDEQIAEIIRLRQEVTEQKAKAMGLDEKEAELKAEREQIRQERLAESRESLQEKRKRLRKVQEQQRQGLEAIPETRQVEIGDKGFGPRMYQELPISEEERQRMLRERELRLLNEEELLVSHIQQIVDTAATELNASQEELGVTQLKSGRYLVEPTPEEVAERRRQREEARKAAELEEKRKEARELIKEYYDKNPIRLDALSLVTDAAQRQQTGNITFTDARNFGGNMSVSNKSAQGGSQSVVLGGGYSIDLTNVPFPGAVN